MKKTYQNPIKQHHNVYRYPPFKGPAWGKSNPVSKNIVQAPNPSSRPNFLPVVASSKRTSRWLAWRTPTSSQLLGQDKGPIEALPAFHHARPTAHGPPPWSRATRLYDLCAAVPAALQIGWGAVKQKFQWRHPLKNEHSREDRCVWTSESQTISWGKAVFSGFQTHTHPHHDWRMATGCLESRDNTLPISYPHHKAPRGKIQLIWLTVESCQLKHLAVLYSTWVFDLKIENHTLFLFFGNP